MQLKYWKSSKQTANLVVHMSFRTCFGVVRGFFLRCFCCRIWFQVGLAFEVENRNSNGYKEKVHLAMHIVLDRLDVSFSKIFDHRSRLKLGPIC